jgi:uncharacterized protein YlxW (UPF0749 family)
MKHNGALLFALLMLFGIVLVMQFRTVTDGQANNGPTARELAQTLETERATGQALRDTLAQLESDYAQQLRGLGERQGDEAFRELLAQRNHTLFRAGLYNVRGSGISMTLNDAAVAGDFAIEDYIIHDSDVFTLLNELRKAGAEAISINGERVLGMTKTVCAGPTILINNSRYPVPFEFKAIGDPQVLYQAMETSEAVNILRLYDIRVEIRIEPELVIEKYRVYGELTDLMTGLEVVVQ